jgi:hypothetical protein
VETTAAGKVQFHEIYSGGNGYLGQNELIVHVGLGGSDHVDGAEFQWPKIGISAPITRTLTGLPAGETWSIYPPGRLCDGDADGDDFDDVEMFSSCFAAGFSPGCEMMDFDGDSDVYADDFLDCFLTSPHDCNANGQEDLLEIMLDPAIDGNQNYAIDCCTSGSITEPNPVGNTLQLAKSGPNQLGLSWTAPPTSPGHDAATSYDVFRHALTFPSGSFALLGNVAGTTATDTLDGPSAIFLVSARNACGSSGEEPF